MSRAFPTVAELMNIGSEEPRGLTKSGLAILDHAAYALIAERRRATNLEQRGDILSMLLQARTEEGEALTYSYRQSIYDVPVYEDATFGYFFHHPGAYLLQAL